MIDAILNSISINLVLDSVFIKSIKNMITGIFPTSQNKSVNNGPVIMDRIKIFCKKVEFKLKLSNIFVHYWPINYHISSAIFVDDFIV